MAAERARESARPDRLFDDPLADALAGPEGGRIMAEMGAEMPENPALPIRTRYFDDRLLNMVGANGITQVVLLAAGMDTRAFRLGFPDDVVVFELDRPALLALKEQRLETTGARPTCDRRTVPADLARPWTHPLLSAGYLETKPAVFVAEGLLGYLSEPQVHELLGTAARLSNPNSVALADVSGRVPPGTPFLDTWSARLTEAGVSRRFATDEPEALFAAHGWRAEVAGYGEETADFGRWPWPVPDRDDPNWPHNYLVTAHRSGS